MQKDKTDKLETIGPFEQAVLTAIMNLGGEAYGVPIYERVCELLEKRVNLGALYVTLDRLNKRGLLSSWTTERADEPRGRSRRFFRLEDSGLRALQDSLENARRFAALFDNDLGGIQKWIRKRTKKPVRQVS